MQPDRSMKPLLAVAVEEAVKLAFVDSCMACEMDKVIQADGIDAWMERGDAIRASWSEDPERIPDEYVASMDKAAFAQNLALRLLGPGGWQTGSLYTGNATPQQTFDASIDRAHRSQVSEVAMDVLDAVARAQADTPRPEGGDGADR